MHPLNQIVQAKHRHDEETGKQPKVGCPNRHARPLVCLADPSLQRHGNAHVSLEHPESIQNDRDAGAIAEQNGKKTTSGERLFDLLALPTTIHR